MAFVFTGKALAFTGVTFVFTCMALVFTGMPFVFTGVAFVFTGMAFVFTGMAFVYTGMAFVFTGMAFETKFTFTCLGWLDEGLRQEQNYTVDSVILSSLKFTLSYEIQQNVTSLVPILQLQGSDLYTPDVMLPYGLEEFDYEVKVIIKIEDRYGGFVNFDISLKVCIIEVSSQIFLLQLYQ